MKRTRNILLDVPGEIFGKQNYGEIINLKKNGHAPHTDIYIYIYIYGDRERDIESRKKEAVTK